MANPWFRKRRRISAHLVASLNFEESEFNAKFSKELVFQLTRGNFLKSVLVSSKYGTPTTSGSAIIKSGCVYMVINDFKKVYGEIISRYTHLFIIESANADFDCTPYGLAAIYLCIYPTLIMQDRRGAYSIGGEETAATYRAAITSINTGYHGMISHKEEDSLKRDLFEKRMRLMVDEIERFTKNATQYVEIQVV